MNLLKERLLNFFWLFGGATLGLYVHRLVFGGGPIEISVLTGLLVFCGICTMLNLLFYSKKELRRRQMYVRVGLHLAMTLALILGVAFFMGWISLGEPIRIITLSAVVVAIYALMMLQTISRSKKDADELNEKLKERYRE